MTEDEVFIAQFKTGDERAFNQLVQKYKSEIISYVRRKVGNDEDADDITQDVFVKMYRALPKWQPRVSFKTWLYTIARNQCTDYHRTQAYHRAQAQH